MRIVCTGLVLQAGVACGPGVPDASGSPRRAETPISTPGSEETGSRAALATLPSGRSFILELAITPEQQSRGYMFRKEIGDDEGMLFLNERPAIRRFWMKNCLVPIDMIWLDDEFRVIAIEHSAPPCREDPCPAYGPFAPSHHILELKGGAAASEGLAPGDRIHVVLDPQRSSMEGPRACRRRAARPLEGGPPLL